MTETSNIKLQKPNADDFFNLETWNTNMDKIDSVIGNKEELLTTDKSNLVAAINENNQEAIKAKQASHQVGKVYEASVNGSVIEIDTDGVYKFEKGMVVKFKLNEAKTGITELKVDSNAALPIQDSDGAEVKDFNANTAYEVWYEDGGSPFFALAPKGGGDEGFTKKTTSENEVLVEKVKKGSYVYCNKETIVGEIFHDEQWTFSTSGRTFGDNTNVETYGQTFTFPYDLNNVSLEIKVRVKKGSNSPTGNVIAKIHKYDGASEIMGSVVATSPDTYAPSTVSTSSYTDITFSFTGLNLTKSINSKENYAFAITADTLSAQPYYIDSTNNDRKPNTTAIFYRGGSWTLGANDLLYEIKMTSPTTQLIPSIHTATSEEQLKVLANGQLLAPEAGVYEGYVTKKAEGLSTMPLGDVPKKSASGSFTHYASNQTVISVTGLNFNPSTIICELGDHDSNGRYYRLGYSPDPKYGHFLSFGLSYYKDGRGTISSWEYFKVVPMTNGFQIRIMVNTWTFPSMSISWKAHE